MAHFENGNQISYICKSYIWTCIKNELKEKPGEKRSENMLFLWDEKPRYRFIQCVPFI